MMQTALIRGAAGGSAARWFIHAAGGIVAEPAARMAADTLLNAAHQGVLDL